MTQKRILKSTLILIRIIICLSTVPLVFGAHILIVSPFFGKSGYGFHVAIVTSLHEAGHKITIVHPFTNDTSSQSFKVIDSSLPDQPDESNFLLIDEALQQLNIFSSLFWQIEMSEIDCYNIIQLEKMQKILHSNEKPFDVMILDLIPSLQECFTPIAEILDIPIIGTRVTKSSWRGDWLISNPNNPAVTPIDLSFCSLKMNFMQRITNSWHWAAHYLMENLFVYPRLKVFYKKHFPNSSVAGRIKPSLIFANIQPVLFPRPSVPNVINIGGIHVETQPAKPLPQYLQTFIEEAKDGVILFSLGSLMKMFEENSPEFNVFIMAFAQIPQRVIWKMEKKVGNLPKNVITSKWLPQRDILAHKNVVAFITHCGISGIFEAVFEAKPLIMIPIFFDQMSNAATLEDLGVGVSLDVKTLSVQKVLNALDRIINDTKYQKKMQNISRIIKDAPTTQKKTVVYWTEYVIRHKGASHLRTTSANIPLYEYLSLDVILCACGMLSALVYFSFRCSKKLFSMRIGTKKHKYCGSRKTK